MIVYIHGLGGSENSEKATFLRNHFELVTMTYPSESADSSFAALDGLIRPLVEKRPVLVGSSLGGFWAYHFAQRYGLPAVLINPATTPSGMLAQHLGPPAAEFLPYEKMQGTPQTIVLVETGDEVIPYRIAVELFSGRADIRVFEGGNHAFQRRAELVTAISELENREQATVSPIQ